MGSTFRVWACASFFVLGLPLLRAAALSAPPDASVVVVKPVCPISAPGGGEGCATPGLRCTYNKVCCPTCPHVCVPTYFASCTESKTWSAAVARVACPPLGGCPPAPSPPSPPPTSGGHHHHCPRRPPAPWSPCKKVHQRCKWGRGCCRCNRSKCWSSTTKAICSARGRKWVVVKKPRPLCPRTGPDCPHRPCPVHTPTSGSRCRKEGPPRCTYGRFCCGCPPSEICFPTEQAICSAGTWTVSPTLLPRCASCMSVPRPPPSPPIPPQCPQRPLRSFSCAPEGLQCPYDEFCCPCTNDCYNTTLNICQGGKWVTVAQDPACALKPSDCAPPPVPQSCPATPPASLSACQQPGTRCEYNTICCGCTTKRCFNTLIFTCTPEKTWKALAINPPSDCMVCP